MSFATIWEYLKNNYVLAASVFVLFVCAVVHFVRSDQIKREEADYDDLVVRRSRVLKNFKYSLELAEDLSAMKEMSDDVEERLFHPENLASNQRYYYEVESVTGVKIEGIQQVIKPLPTGKANKKARAIAARSKYREILYNINVSGTYEQILSFFREVEGGDAFVRLVGVQLLPKGRSGSETISMQLAIETLGVKS